MVRGLVASCAAVVLVGSLGAVAPAGATAWGEPPPPQKIVPGMVLRLAPETTPERPAAGPAAGPVAAPVINRLRRAVEAPTSRDLTMVHANITSRQSTGAFTADLNRALASQPDFLTLNEAVRPDELIAREGYTFHRGYDSRWTMETTVMWRDDWSVVTTGTRYLHQRGGTWGTRAVNWVVLEDPQTGQQVSVVSAHPSPEGPSSRGLLPVYMSGLARLVNELGANGGPVFVGGDLNAHYTSGRFPRPAIASAGLAPTYDAFGMPAGGTGDHGGATIDYLLYQPSRGVTATGQSKLELASDHDAIVGTFTWTW